MSDPINQTIANPDADHTEVKKHLEYLDKQLAENPNAKQHAQKLLLQHMIGKTQLNESQEAMCRSTARCVEEDPVTEALNEMNSLANTISNAYPQIAEQMKKVLRKCNTIWSGGCCHLEIAHSFVLTALQIFVQHLISIEGVQQYSSLLNNYIKEIKDGTEMKVEGDDLVTKMITKGGVHRDTSIDIMKGCYPGFYNNLKSNDFYRNLKSYQFKGKPAKFYLGCCILPVKEVREALTHFLSMLPKDYKKTAIEFPIQVASSSLGKLQPKRVGLQAVEEAYDLAQKTKGETNCLADYCIARGIIAAVNRGIAICNNGKK